jgi:hypothetical protein
MPRYIRNTVLAAKIETTYGTDSTPTVGSNALLISDVSINPLNAQNVPRNLIRAYMGGSENLVGPASVECQFTVELQSSGTAGVAPAWGPLLRGCGMAETLTTAARAEYLPVSTGFESLSMYYWDDGLLHKIVGARGSFSLMAKVSERPMLQFQMVGIDAGVVATAAGNPTLTAWRVPSVVSDTATADLVVGGTYTTGTIGSGTGYISTGLELALGAAATFIPLIGQESVDITNREVSGKVMVDLTAAQEATFSTSVKANTLQSIGLTHGTAAGSTVVVFGPAVQFTNWRKEELQGRRMLGYDLRFTPSTGNDELRIVAR